MRTLIVPDVHEKVDKLERALKSTKHDKVVFLGDYFDKFGQPNTLEIATWLKHNLSNPNYTFLLGNHDVHYFFGLEQCSGFTHEKKITIRQVLTQSDISKFKFFELVDNKWLCSHAGFHPGLFDTLLTTEDQLKQFKTTQSKVLRLVSNGARHEWIRAGVSRGGDAAEGGVTWLDFKDFQPIHGFNQIVGHTHRDFVREKHLSTSKNYCIDTGLNHAILIEDGKEKVLAV